MCEDALLVKRRKEIKRHILNTCDSKIVLKKDRRRKRVLEKRSRWGKELNL